MTILGPPVACCIECEIPLDAEWALEELMCPDCKLDHDRKLDAVFADFMAGNDITRSVVA
jgi:exosome complex RNA-binding protein Csl4